MFDATEYSVQDGIKAYSKVGLRFYDAFIMCGLAPSVWGCSAQAFLQQYDEHLSGNHAEIGVGTGFVLDRCVFRTERPRLALIDLQPHCLAYAARRLARLQPEIHVRDVCEPIHGVGSFDSIALGGILHCLPGDMRAKGRVFEHLKNIARPGARIFGYTLVNDAVASRPMRRLTWRVLHAMRVIHCANDSANDLTHALSTRFINYSVELIGCFAFFHAVVPRGAATHLSTSQTRSRS